jgi:hypothetical protein
MDSPGRSRQPCDFDAQELRQSTRFRKEPGTDFAVIWRQPGDELLAEVYDESLTGICLVMADASHYPVGAEADLVYHATAMHGEVRHVTPRANGTYLVGLACERWPAGDPHLATQTPPR